MAWLADAHGDLLEPLPTCAGFTVRYWPPSARGPGAPLRDDSGSTALIVPTHVTPEQFRTLVGNRPGRYVLSPVSATRKPLRAPAAVVVLDAGVELDDAIGTSALATILAAIDAAEQRTTAALTQLAAQLAAHRASIDQQLVELRAALRTVDARATSVLALLGSPAPATAPTAPKVKRSSTSPSPLAATPTPPAPPPLTLEAMFHAATDAHQAHLATLTAIVDALPPLPRAVFGAILRDGDDARITPLLALAALPRDVVIHALSTAPTLIEPTQRMMAATLEIPIDQLRAAWIERDEQALPAPVRAAITTIAAPRRDQ